MIARSLPANVRLEDHGVASAYVVLPLGELRKEIAELRELKPSALDSDRAEGGVDGAEEPGEKHAHEGIRAEQIVGLVGQADLLAQYRIDDFRRVVVADYPKPSSRAQVLNWIFSVPCVTVGAPNEAHAAGKTMRFTMHLRFRRTVYAFDAVHDERCILGYVSDRLLEAGCAATIHAGLGWADFIVDGNFDPAKLREFVDFLVKVHEGCIVGPDGIRRESVFVRTMTLIGFQWPLNDDEDFTPPEIPGATPVTFVRAAPGQIHQAIADVLAKQRPAHIKLIDGKSDFVVVSNGVEPDVLARNLKLSDAAAASRRRSIQRLETHVVYTDEAERDSGTRNRDDVVVFDSPTTIPGECGCRTAGHWRRTEPAQADLSKWLPKELRQSVMNALFLSGSTLRDELLAATSPRPSAVRKAPWRGSASSSTSSTSVAASSTSFTSSGAVEMTRRE